MKRKISAGSVVLFLIMWVSICLAGKSRTVSHASPESEIGAREDDYTRGVRNKDVRLLNEVFAETFIDTSESGKLIDKRHYLELVKTDRSTINSLVIDQMKIIVYGDAAVASSRFFVKGTDEHGKRFEEWGRATDVWVKQKGEWICAAAHSSPIKE